MNETYDSRQGVYGTHVWNVDMWWVTWNRWWIGKSIFYFTDLVESEHVIFYILTKGLNLERK